MRGRGIKYLFGMCCALLVWNYSATETWATKLQEGDNFEFNYTGSMQEFCVPQNGIYQLEVWGAQGGASDGTTVNWDGHLDGGTGGYSKGYIMLKKNDVIYICVGGEGTHSRNRNEGVFYAGGYNGGGYSYSGDGCMNAAGGGATSMSSISGTIKEIGLQNLNKIYLIAGGGGGASNGYNSHIRSNGGRGGGLVSEGGVNSSCTTQAATQTSGYAFGQGANANGNSGSGGGGGLYGGTTLGVTSGGGGSGYIGGVPSFEWKGTEYAPVSSIGGRYGNGFAKITYVGSVVNATLLTENISVIEKQTVDMEVQVEQVEDYQWEYQERSSRDNPDETLWKSISENEKFHISDTISEQNGTIHLSFQADVTDGDYWFRVKVFGDDTEAVSNYCTLNIEPLRITGIEIIKSPNGKEVGDTVNRTELEIELKYNNPDYSEKINANHPLMKNIYFLKNNELFEEIECDQISDDYKIEVVLQHADQPTHGISSFQVTDTVPPKIINAELNEFDFCEYPEEKNFKLVITAEDKSNDVLEYWILNEEIGWESEHNNTGTFQFSLQNNAIITICVKDKSGNITRIDKKINYVLEKNIQGNTKQMTINEDEDMQLDGMIMEMEIVQSESNNRREKHPKIEGNDDILAEDYLEVYEMLPQEEMGGKNEREPLKDKKISVIKESFKIPLSDGEKNEVWTATETMAVIGGSTTGGAWFFFLLFINKAELYYINENREEEFMKRKRIKKKKNYFTLDLSKNSKELCHNGLYRIKLSKRFVKKHRDAYFEIKLKENSSQTIRISDCMEFYMGNHL